MRGTAGTATLTDLLGPARPAVVVGAAQGIGREIAAQLLRYGLAERLILVDVDGERLGRAVEDLARGHAVPVEAVVADLRDEKAMAAAMRGVDGPAFGVVVAGVFEGGPTVSVETSSIARVVDVNLLGAMAAARVIARRLAEVGGGSLVAVTSTASRIPHLEQAAYAASKAGLAQAMRVLGLEMAEHGVRVNTVAPGPTNTRLVRLALDTKPLADGDLDRYRSRIPRGRIAEAAEIASVIVLLLSDATSQSTCRRSSSTAVSCWGGRHPGS